MMNRFLEGRWVMKMMLRAAVIVGGGVFCVLAIATDGVAQDPGVQSLRGPVGIEDTAPAEDLKQQNVDARFQRAYRQQPPLIPHKIDKYQINLKVNQCLHCHDWPYNAQEGAPKVSETHYRDRNGVALDKVSRARWFCTQCHVPQERARALVGNTFHSAFDTK